MELLRLSVEMRHFSYFIKECCLRKFPLYGGLFTWYGGLNSQSSSRLDHFSVSEKWEDHFSGFSQFVLPKPLSNHCPVVLKGGGIKRSKAPFRFENMRIKADGFKDLIRS